MASPEDVGTFVNNVESASFAIWDDSDNPNLTEWVEKFDFEAFKLTEPNGMVLGGVIDFVKSPVDFGLDYKVCFFQDGWEEAKCAAIHHSMSMFTSEIIRADSIPEDEELVDVGSLFTLQPVGMTGINNIFGQEFDS